MKKDMYNSLNNEDRLDIKIQFSLKLICIIVIFPLSIACTKIKDDGTRGFMSKATIVENNGNGYICYLDNGGFVFSKDKGLDGVKRGYFSFSYMESDWIKSTKGEEYISNAIVRAWPNYGVYDIVHPISIDNVQAEEIIKNGKNKVPTFWSLTSCNGYLDLNMGIATFNRINGKETRATINIVYDPEKQKPDTLLLKLYYNPNIPSDWIKTSDTYGEISCDISSFTKFKQWRDSVVVVIDTGDNKVHSTKTHKNNFNKPSWAKKILSRKKHQQ